LNGVAVPAISASIATSAAGAFGSLLCGAKPLWIQRLTHKTLKQIEPTLKLEAERDTKSTAERLGFATVLCHIVCTGTLKSASLAKRGEIVKILVDMLGAGTLTSDEVVTIPREVSEVKRLLVASILKLGHTSPGLVSKSAT
jgi:hypothetical protein